jgi:hypothetical protein
LLEDVVALSSHSKWVEMYETIHLKMKALQASCTNRDFNYGQNSPVNGLDDKCALCVIVLRVFENWVNYHNK